jgi:hypothetical protein
MDENEMCQPDKDLAALSKSAYAVAPYIDAPANTNSAQHAAVTANVNTTTSDKPNETLMSTQGEDAVRKCLFGLQKIVQREKTKRLQELEPELKSLIERLQNLGYKLDNNKAVPILDMNLLCAVSRDPVNGTSILKDTWTLIKSYHAVDPSMLDNLRHQITKLQSERSSVVTTNPDSPTLSETNDTVELWWPDCEIDVRLCIWKRMVSNIMDEIRKEKRFSEIMAKIEKKQHYEELIAEYEQRKCRQALRDLCREAGMMDPIAYYRSMEDIMTYHPYNPEEMWTSNSPGWHHDQKVQLELEGKSM